MRFHIRPEYVLHKTFHHARVSLSVWRNNRAAGEAFRDPAMLNNVYGPWNRVTQRSRNRRFAIGALLVISLVAFLSRRPAPDPDPDPDPGIMNLQASVPPAGAVSAPLVSLPTIVPRNPSAPSALVPAQPDEPVGFPEQGFILIACKRDRTLYVYKRAGKSWNRTAAFPMAIGRNSGDKGRAGDLRTPEGRFWITGMLSGVQKGPIYGPLVFTLNYPRPGDMAEGKTGVGIWIHGVEAGKLPSFTKGCLALANEDVLALGAYADIATPIVILSDTLGPDPGRQVDMTGMEGEYPSIISAYGRKTAKDTAARESILEHAREFVAKEAKKFPELAMQALSEQDRKEVLARLERWRADWSSRSIEAYAANYDAAFRDRNGHDKQAFMERKRAIFGSKTRIEMEIREPRIESESYSRVKVTFRQDYLAEGPQGTQRSSEPKSLRLDEGPGGWLIITE